MDRVFEIQTVRQLRVLNTPATRAVFEGMLDARATGAKGVDGGLTAFEAGKKVGMSAESAHYHLRKLESIGLAQQISERKTGARPEKVFGLTCTRVELRRGRRGPAYLRELVRGVRLMLRLADREYERACLAGEKWTIRPRVARQVGWLTPSEVTELDRLEERMLAVFRKAQARANRDGRAGRERVSVTMVLAPTEREGL